MSGPEPCAVCGALPCDQTQVGDLSAAITALFTHGIISDGERLKARQRLRKLAEKPA